MPSVITHAIGSYFLNRGIFRSKFSWKLVLAIIVSAMIPDSDAIGFHHGVAYESMFGHRGFTHSIFFALAWASIVWILFFKKGEQKPLFYITILFVSTISHPVFDMFTNANHGVALLFPFSNHRYISSWNPIKAAPISITRFFSEWGLNCIKSEFKYVWLPTFIFCLIMKFIHKVEK